MLLGLRYFLKVCLALFNNSKTLSIRGFTVVPIYFYSFGCKNTSFIWRTKSLMRPISNFVHIYFCIFFVYFKNDCNFSDMDEQQWSYQCTNNADFFFRYSLFVSSLKTCLTCPFHPSKRKKIKFWKNSIVKVAIVKNIVNCIGVLRIYFIWQNINEKKIMPLTHYTNH